MKVGPFVLEKFSFFDNQIFCGQMDAGKSVKYAAHIFVTFGPTGLKKYSFLKYACRSIFWVRIDVVISLEVCSVTFVKVGPFELEKVSFFADQIFCGEMDAGRSLEYAVHIFLPFGLIWS